MLNWDEHEQKVYKLRARFGIAYLDSNVKETEQIKSRLLTKEDQSDKVCIICRWAKNSIKSYSLCRTVG